MMCLQGQGWGGVCMCMCVCAHACVCCGPASPEVPGPTLPGLVANASASFKYWEKIQAESQDCRSMQFRQKEARRRAITSNFLQHGTSFLPFLLTNELESF